MQQTELVHLTYADSFRCIGPTCEDNCCHGFTVPVDQAATEKFRILPHGALRTLIDANVVLTPQGDGASKPATFATFRMTPSNTCPLLSEDRLCRIQREFGEAFLPQACSAYPRIVCSVGDIEEKALALSCPEAARLVLLNPTLLEPSDAGVLDPRPSHHQEGDVVEGSGPMRPWFWSIRKSVLSLLLNRTVPLWQRMFLLGVLCRGLDSIAQGEFKCSVAAFLQDFDLTVSSGTLQASLEALPIDLTRQLDIVLQMAGMLLHNSNANPRFVDCVQAFTAGIGNRAGATLESLTARYALAHERWYGPFFDRQPHILENYLVNTVLRCQFPFGRDAMRTGATPSMTRQHVLLTAQFALMNGFLIGVAGFHGEAFSTDHVVHTVQSASKHFEHHLEFLDQTHALLVKNQMDTERGIAILLRNSRRA